MRSPYQPGPRWPVDSKPQRGHVRNITYVPRWRARIVVAAR
ncbi:hypothetical protein [Mycobacterium sp. ACS1612]|nr:hypothetical protein [Mycobacterium sp. ACS1612]